MKLKDIKNTMLVLFKVLNCSHCGQNFKASNVHLLKQPKEEDGILSLLVHSDCEKCHASVITNVLLDNGDVIGTTIKTDLTALDATRLLQKNPITTDDVILIHAGMESLGEQISLITSARKRGTTSL